MFKTTLQLPSLNCLFNSLLRETKRNSGNMLSLHAVLGVTRLFSFEEGGRGWLWLQVEAGKLDSLSGEVSSHRKSKKSWSVKSKSLYSYCQRILGPELLPPGESCSTYLSCPAIFQNRTLSVNHSSGRGQYLLPSPGFIFLNKFLYFVSTFLCNLCLIC